MRSNDPAARNLFLRLFTYVPTQGEKRDRAPLEDFCTEALAYLLTTSPARHQSFIGRILKLPTAAGTEHLNVSTQGANDCKIDLALGTEIGIEVKITAPPQPGQAKKYARAFTTKFLLSKRAYKYLPEFEGEGFRLIYWEDIQRWLLDNVVGETDASADLAKQFAAFLSNEGMKNVNVNQDRNALVGICNAAKLLDEWNQFLFSKLRAKLGFADRPSNVPCWSERDDKFPSSSFFGVFGKTDDKYAGFKIDEGGKVWCYYEDSVVWLGIRPPGFQGPSGCGTATELANGKIYLSLWCAYPETPGDISAELLRRFKEMQTACEVRMDNLRALAARVG
jgi:hypothetical protein